MKTALITGITGQDGSYLAEHLLGEQRYDRVIGLARSTAAASLGNIRPVLGHPGLTLVEGDVADSGLLARIFSAQRIDECYNLAAQSFVGASFDDPATTFSTNLLGAVGLLDAIRGESPATRCYQASSSAMYGAPAASGTSPGPGVYHPDSPYGCSKLAAFLHAVNMREAFGLFVCNGIAFNHESPRRGEQFLTRKVVNGAAAYRAWLDAGAAGPAPMLTLGNLAARRDWGHARDYVRAMWLMLQRDEPDDYVLATGETHSVRRFVELAYGHPAVGARLRWEGEGADEIGRDGSGRVVVAVDPAHFRPTEADSPPGDASKAREVLGWSPAVDFAGVVDEMVTSALASIET